MTDDDEPMIINSPLSCRFEGDGTFIDVEIYRAQDDVVWILEVVDELEVSTIYEDPFETEQALDEVLAAIQEYGIRMYLEDGFPNDEEVSGTIH